MTDFLNRAREMDLQDELAHFREEFHFPESPGKSCIYFTGNSLGLQPKSAREAIESELDDWAKYGVEGHFEARNPWYSYHEQLMDTGARMLGANYGEVVHMNGLTTNIHLLMVSFYRPKPKKYKILCEAKAFPSDQYALESQVRFHGFDPDDAIIEVGPRPGEHLIRQEDIIQAIADNADELALVFWGGVNYYTGQLFDMEKIAAAAGKYQITVGFDLAHAAGNVPMYLHDWNVDFAAWCTYKYFNSGPGSVSGIFIHEKHHKNSEIKRFAGWWGHNKDKRFKMEKGFDPIPSAEAWQLSNAPIFSMAPHLASLAIFKQAGMNKLRAKSLKLTSFLEEVIRAVAENNKADIELITPANPEERGCQLSILLKGYDKSLFNLLTAKGVFADWREPNVIRVAPVPLYNSFADCATFGEILGDAFKKIGNK